MICSKCGKEITDISGKCLECERLSNEGNILPTEVEIIEKTVELPTPNEKDSLRSQPDTEQITKPVVETSPKFETAIVDGSSETNKGIVENANKQNQIDSKANQTFLVSEEKEKKKSKIFNIRNLILLIVFIVIITIGLLIYSLIIGFEKLEWDDTYKANSLDYVSSTTIELGIKFSNNDKLDSIKYETTCGELTVKDLKLKWNLKDAIGECHIAASYKTKKISKTLTVIPTNIGNEELALKYEIDLDSEEDLDLDNLTNKQEKEYNTNPLLADSDMDGLNDDYELFVSKTDPNKADTDGDGLSDYDEIELGLDPLNPDSKNDGIKDGERDLTYTYQKDNIELEIKGKGNIASTIAEINTNTKISGKTGLLDNLYNFYTDGKLTEATVKIKYTTEEIEKAGLNEDNLTLYYFNDKTSKYEKINTTIDKENKVLIAKLTHFSYYVVGDKSQVKEEATTQILFVLDNSWSMYSNEQYKELTGKDYNGGIGNSELGGFDKEGIRFTLTSDLASKLNNKGYEIGLSEFRRDYANALPIGSSIDSIKKKLETMNGSFITSIEGTSIYSALNGGIKEFSRDIDNKYIVILTDGEDTTLKSYSSSIINSALNNNVKICSIGFGDGSNNESLSNISNATGCRFFSSSNVTGLTELFDNIDAELNNDLIDMDGDEESDGILLADSGFIVTRDGFSFENYGTNLSTDGHCYGMATFAELYYLQKLPLSSKAITSGDLTSYAYNLNNTYFKKYGNLYDFRLTTKVLKYTFGYEYFDEKIPEDLRSLDGNTLIINKKYKKELKDSGLYTIEIAESKLNKEKQLSKWGVTYKYSENFIFDEEKMQSNETISNDEKQLLNAIYASFIKQKTDVNYSSSMDFLLWLRTVYGTEIIEYTGEGGFINVLKSRLNNNDPVVISSAFSGGLHAINAINLIQDINNPNHYYIGVYDNNYPGEKRYVDIICKNNKCVTQANEYYTSSNEPIRISPSLEHDLSYYNK